MVHNVLSVLLKALNCWNCGALVRKLVSDNKQIIVWFPTGDPENLF
jgi:hypothetical protein